MRQAHRPASAPRCAPLTGGGALRAHSGSLAKPGAVQTSGKPWLCASCQERYPAAGGGGLCVFCATVVAGLRAAVERYGLAEGTDPDLVAALQVTA